jgi:hypothetical protein
MPLWKNQNHEPELAALRFMDCEGICKLQCSITLVIELSAIEIVGIAGLRGKLNLDDFWGSTHFFGLPLTDYNTDLAIGKIA